MYRKIYSKWPGKCKLCSRPVSKGDSVWWDAHLRGVLCGKCYRAGLPDSKPEPSESKPEKEEEDLSRLPNIENLKPGHELRLGYTGLDIVMQSSLHAQACDCVACVVHHRGDNRDNREYHLKGFYVLSTVRNGWVYSLPFPKPDTHRYSGQYYVVGVAMEKITDSGTESYCSAIDIPVEWISAGTGTPNTTVLSVVAGGKGSEPSPTKIDTIKWANGTESRLGHGKSQYLVHADGTVIDKYLPGTSFSGLETGASGVFSRVRFVTGEITSGSSYIQCNCGDGGCAAISSLVSKTDWNSIIFAISGEESGFGRKVVFSDPSGIRHELDVDVFSNKTSYDLLSKYGFTVRLADNHMREVTSNNPGVEEQPSMTSAKPSPAIPVAATADLSGAAIQLIAALQSSAVPEEKVRQIVLDTVREELQKLPAKRHKIKIGDQPDIEFEGTMHSMATEIVEAILSGFHNIMIVGPAGSGKTFLFSQVATILKNRMGWDEKDYMASMSCAPGQTESMFIGRMIPSLTTGQETYHGTNLTRLYAKEKGGAFLFDEISNSEPTVMNLVNSMIALDGHVTLPDGRVLTRPENMVIFAADNTWGQGGDRMYIRNQLDAATLDRFTGAKFFMDYDAKLEAALCPAKEVYEAVTALRKKTTDLKLRRIVSTRAFAAAQRMSNAGVNVKDILRRLTIDWSENDRKSVGA
jgi:MoxR-like ATPase